MNIGDHKAFVTNSRFLIRSHVYITVYSIEVCRSVVVPLLCFSTLLFDSCAVLSHFFTREGFKKHMASGVNVTWY